MYPKGSTYILGQKYCGSTFKLGNMHWGSTFSQGVLLGRYTGVYHDLIRDRTELIFKTSEIRMIRYLCTLFYLDKRHHIIKFQGSVKNNHGDKRGIVKFYLKAYISAISQSKPPFLRGSSAYSLEITKRG